MKTSQQVLAFLLLLALAIKEGLALECFSCNNFSDDNCEHVNENTNVEFCAVNQTMCRKIEQQIHYNGIDNTRIFRQCATTGSVGDCLERTGTYRYKSWYCQCMGDKCNGAENVLTSISLIVVMMVTVFGISKLL